MVSVHGIATTIILISALILVQGTAALTIEQAPLNPAFVAYTEGLSEGTIDQYSIECDGDSCPATGTGSYPYATGLLPAPAVVVWPDEYAADVATSTDTASFPALFDLRDEGRVTPVRDQGQCGSCWVFATYGSLESSYLTDTGEAENFSENNMNNLCSSEYPDGFDYAPCMGGFAFMSTAYLTRGSGPLLEAEDPYALPVPSNISPTNLPPVLNVHDVTFLPPRTGPLDNTYFKQTLMDEGALWVAFAVNWSCFADNDTTYFWPGDAYAIDGGHAVTLVGWDDAFPAAAFAVTPPGDGAFILKNSWGTEVGDEGYFYISYYDPILGTYWEDGQHYYGDADRYGAAGVLYTGLPADSSERIYQYDPLGWTGSVGTGTATTFYGANVFTAERYEELTSVSFNTREPGTEYTVAVFTDFTTPPGDAAPVAWTSGTAALPGYHTVSLPESVPLLPGEVFSVVLDVTSPTDTHPLVVEMPVAEYSSRATAEAGESYVSGDGDTWEDVTLSFPDTNVCIKAHTDSLTVVPRDYATIMEAVNASASGDTIIVTAGIYPENLVLNKTVTLLGTGTPSVCPPPGSWPTIWADNVTIAGFVFEGSVPGIGIDIQGNDCTIFDTEISGFTFGLISGPVHGLSLSTIALHDNSYNLYFMGDFMENPGNTIDETVTVDGRPVIYREGVSGETIDAASDAGIVICVNATDITIRDITTGTTETGISLFFCKDIRVENVTADAVFNGLKVVSSENVTIRQSTFDSDGAIGIYVDGATGLQVEENEIICTNSGAGIMFSGLENSSITNNTIRTGTAGMVFMGIWGGRVSGLVVAGNTIEESTEYGISIMSGEDLMLTGNTINTLGYGMVVYEVQTVTVSDNIVRCNSMTLANAIIADGADIFENTFESNNMSAMMILNNSTVRENRFSGAEYPVIDVVESGDNVFVYRNDFVLTGENALEDTSVHAITGNTAETDAGAFTTGSMDTDTCLQEMRDATDGIHNSGLWDEAMMHTLSGNGASGFIEDIPGQDASLPGADRAVGYDTAVWHSPTAETYWYYGQWYTRLMGNYWSTYTGTDTTLDGIGDTPFVYQNYTADLYPLVSPSASYFDGNPMPPVNDDPSGSIASAGPLSAGESVTFTFTGSAVQTVTLTTAGDTGRVLLSLGQAGTGPSGLAGPVYLYLSADLSGITDDAVKEAVFSFRVPTAWLKAEGLLPVDMALWRFHDGTWQELPVTVIREENGWVYFEAVSPGFSTFAIAGGAIENLISDMGPQETEGESETGIDTADVAISVTAPSGNETAAEPQVTVAIPEEESMAAEGTGTATPQESPSGLLSIIGGVGACAVILFRRQ